VHNRRDQVQAHGFMVGRLVSALLRAEPDMGIPPLRRSWSGLIIGFLVAALALAGCSVMAAVAPGAAASWRKPGTLILNRQTGSRFVLAGGLLHPVLNYASARLLLGAKIKVAQVPAKKLRDLPLAGPLGIKGAPDSLPSPDGGGRPWFVCASSNGSRPALSLLIGEEGGERPVSPEQALVVRTSDGTTYLIAEGRRLRVTAPWVTRALGFPDDDAIGVRDAWVDTLPAGPDLPPAAVSGTGESAPDLDGQPTKVGEVFAVRGPGTDQRFYQRTDGGLQPLTRTAAVLALSDPHTVNPHPDGATVMARDLSPAALAASTLLSAPPWMAYLPSGPPTTDAVTAGRMPCVRTVPGTAATSVVTVPAVPVAGATMPAGLPASGNATAADPAGNRIADLVAVAPRAGLFARTLPAPGVAGAGLYVVTEDGAKFPVADADAATALGYATSAAVTVPADLLALLPTGPVLRMLASGGE
jgi:type VII secretion protein EccB